jgi:hypothetical protein
MIPELDRYHGVVLRQIFVAHRHAVHFGIADLSGRIDAFRIEQAAFQIKHSSKRLSPWQFTYFPEHLAELDELRRTFAPVWVFLVCGQDGVVGLASEELSSVAQVTEGGAAWLRVSRSRNSMFRVKGALGEVPRAIPRGVHGFLARVFESKSEVEGA